MGNNRSNLGVPAGWSHQDRRFGESIKQNLDVLVGQRGDKLDRAVTFRDLLDAGIVVLASGVTNFDGNASSIGLTQSVPNLAIPPAPTNLSADGAFQNILIGFDLQAYIGHSHVELWRNTTDNIATAEMVAQISTVKGKYSDAVGSGSTFYYWVRAVNQNAIIGPFNSSTGTLGQTAPDVQLLLTTLNGAITSSELASTLSTPIAAIPGIQNSVSGINTDISTLTSDVNAINTSIANVVTTSSLNTALGSYTTTTSLESNYYTLNEANSAIQAAVLGLASTTELNTALGSYTSTADLTNNYYTKTGADSATAAAINTFNTNTLGANYTNTADLTTNYYTKTTADSAISAAITTYNTNTIGANYSTTASIAQNYYTKTQADTAFASTADILNAQVDDPNGGTNQVTLAQAMSTQADVNGDLNGQYTVKIDTNGAVAGFGLASTTTSLGTNESEFIINADRFALMRGGSNTSTAVSPFTVQATATTINGIAVPAGVYMDAAFIKAASITSAQIGSINADTINAGVISADYISGGTIDASQINIAGVTTGLNIRSAASGARMEIAANVIKIYDANRLRVQLGQI